ncbi:MAG TPA: serine hydrolase domain-containing protein [Candidatus Dormibacteraeota bacterium]|nr:serine hydrolase domain-containing protein [Candidatus Dormibacteraeota bacterium]
MTQSRAATVDGSCDQRFGLVREEFERSFAERGEVGASVCVTVEGRTVVDLWGGVADTASGRPWQRDTLTHVWSNTKGATALCLHVLIDRGEVALDAPVSRYWPEFAAAGKDGVTVRQLLAHQAGLAAVRKPLPAGALYDWELMTTSLAAETPFWEPGTRNGYHALTFGFLVGELVRRVSGHSLGTFFRAEVATPLGIDFWIGLPEQDEERVAPVVPPAPDPATFSAFERLAFGDPTSLPGLIFTNSGGYMMPGECDTRAAHVAEMGAVGGLTNGRGLAGMYAPLANGGGPLVSETAVGRMGAVASATSVDATLLAPTRFALGFVKSIDNRALPLVNGSVILSEPAFGHTGMGGSIGFCDPVARLSFGYAMNVMGAGMGLNERGQRLVDAMYRSLGYQGTESGAWA